MWRIFTTIASTSLFLASATMVAKSNPTKSMAAQNQTPTEIARVDLSKHSKKYSRGDGDRLEKLEEQLDLSTEQTQQIDTIEQESQTQTNELRLQIKEAHLQMERLVIDDASDEELRQQYQQIQQLQQQISDIRFETRLQIRNVLTAEQRTQLANLTYRHWGDWGDRWER